MSIGGYNHELHEPNAETKIINFSSSNGFYDVHLSKIRLGDISIDLSEYSPIIDSGTTLCFGPQAIIK